MLCGFVNLNIKKLCWIKVGLYLGDPTTNFLKDCFAVCKIRRASAASSLGHYMIGVTYPVEREIFRSSSCG